MQHFETSSRLSPRDQTGMNLTGMGVAHFFNRRYEAAAANLLVSLQHLSNWAVTYRFLASCYAHMGRLDEARDVVERLRAITPVVVPSVPPYRNPEHRELFLSGLRLAAGEAESVRS
jgi:pentatricopeptide repeat protein